MTRATKPAKSRSEGDRSEEDYERFETLTKALIAVPKAEIQAEAEKHKKTEKARRSA